MSTPVFSDPAMVNALQVELESWLGTPFFPRTATKGVGVDCIRFAAAVLENIGVVRAADWPRYAIKGGGADEIETINSRVLSESCLRVVTPPPWMPGDVILCRQPLHVGIVGHDGYVWQSLHQGGVQRGIISSDLLPRLGAVFRAMRP